MPEIAKPAGRPPVNVLFEAKAVIKAKPLVRALPQNSQIDRRYEANATFAPKVRVTYLFMVRSIGALSGGMGEF